MTFDEAIKKLEEHDITKLFNSHTIIEIVKQLQQEYAPTVEMTKEQHDYIWPLIKEGKELGATFTEFWEVYKFIGASKKLKPAFESQEQAMQLWLHPEIINVVDK